MLLSRLLFSTALFASVLSIPVKESTASNPDCPHCVKCLETCLHGHPTAVDALMHVGAGGEATMEDMKGWKMCNGMCYTVCVC
ncbi:hypothetical protein BT69DRAFT_1054245 [Atractiella rhizophila]|nr:hypothetical protein BT69DRAFT_1054245 [Atractiella rhizophila]